MATVSLDEFLRLVERSQLVAADDLAQLVADWRQQTSADRAVDAQACADYLVGREALTRWQSHKLLEGRHRGFQLANYKLLDHLGSGGMSNVYLAEHVLMQRRVAIKVLPQDRVAEGSFLDRFRFEGQAVAALNHPNIVRAYDSGSEGRIHYLVMEYVDGHDLAALVGRDGPMQPHRAANYMAQAAAGLEHAHGSGLVHRDVKPANLLVDHHGTLRILDMGLAKFEAEVRPPPDFARDDEVLGTAEYLAPEQTVSSLAVDHRADIYGLGCTFYFLLAGRPPFEADEPIELLMAHRRELPADLQQLRPELPETLVAICRQMMEKDPARRFQSAREVVAALDGWLRSERAAGRLVEGGSPTDPSTRDTLTDVHETAKIDRAVSEASGRLQDTPATRPAPIADMPDTAAPPVPPPPPAPPVVPPPRQADSGAIPTAVPLASAASQDAQHDAAPRVAVRPRRQLLGRGRSGRTSSRAAGLFWTLLVSALVLGVVLLALFAYVE